MEVGRLAAIAVDCGFRLHKEIGPGLLESVYGALLTDSLRARGLFGDGIQRVVNKHRNGA